MDLCLTFRTDAGWDIRRTHLYANPIPAESSRDIDRNNRGAAGGFANLAGTGLPAHPMIDQLVST